MMYARLTDILGTLTSRLKNLLPAVINPEALSDDELTVRGIARVEVTRPPLEWWQTYGEPVIDDTVRPVTITYPAIDRPVEQVRLMAATRVQRDDIAASERQAVLARERIAAADDREIPVRVDGVTVWMSPEDALADAREQIEAAVFADLVTWVQQDTAADAADLAAVVASAETPQFWVQPTGAHDAYPMDFLVLHNGNLWRSTTAANVWEPGVSGWRNTTQPDTGYPAWVQPTGAHDTYSIGDRVTHNGVDWECSVDSNSWEPGVYGWVQL